MAKVQLINTEPHTMNRWVIKHENGELCAASIYTNKLHLASNLSPQEIDKLRNEIANSKYEIEIYEP